MPPNFEHASWKKEPRFTIDEVRDAVKDCKIEVEVSPTDVSSENKADDFIGNKHFTSILKIRYKSQVVLNKAIEISKPYFIHERS